MVRVQGRDPSLCGTAMNEQNTSEDCMHYAFSSGGLSRMCLPASRLQSLATVFVVTGDPCCLTLRVHRNRDLKASGTKVGAICARLQPMLGRHY